MCSVNGIIRLIGSVCLGPKVIPLSGAHCKRNKALNWTMIYQWDNSFTQPHAWIEPRTETNTPSHPGTSSQPGRKYVFHHSKSNTQFKIVKSSNKIQHFYSKFLASDQGKVWVDFNNKQTFPWHGLKNFFLLILRKS